MHCGKTPPNEYHAEQTARESAGVEFVKYTVIPLGAEHKQSVESRAVEAWGGLTIAVHRELYDLSELPCFIAVSEADGPLGYCYYRFSGDECEIMALESFHEKMGVGFAMISAVRETALSHGCHRLYLQTTNDNIHAIGYYQRRGFTMCAVRFNELDYSRKLKPSIPLIGENGISLRHEIEFEMKLCDGVESRE